MKKTERLYGVPPEKYAKLQIELCEMKLADINNELGLLYVKKGDVERAKTEWQSSLIIDPENQRAKDLLAEHP